MKSAGQIKHAATLDERKRLNLVIDTQIELLWERVNSAKTDDIKCSLDNRHPRIERSQEARQLSDPWPTHRIQSESTMIDQYTPYGAGKLAGAAEERERIIKLLKTEWLSIADGEAVIALINGENK